LVFTALSTNYIRRRLAKPSVNLSRQYSSGLYRRGILLKKKLFVD
jgi:hypothetical protein